MKIKELYIENLKGVRQVHLTNVPDTVVIAGPNGCGKSSVLDCIRILKSVHGGYEPGEADLLWNDMGATRRFGLRSLLRDRNSPGRVEAVVEFSDREHDFLTSGDAKYAITEAAWRRRFPQQDMWQLRWRGIRTPEMLQSTKEVEQEAEVMQGKIRSELQQRRVRALLDIQPGGQVVISAATTLHVAWSTFQPSRLGVVDFHGSQRTYAREALNQITLNEDDEENRWRSSSLYNYANKYTNVKNAMASEYIRTVLRTRSDGTLPDSGPNMIDEMRELIGGFLKGKTFDGPVIGKDGEITFPVVTSDGTTHDIDDLSSGEKEVVFGYLRAKTQTPTDSIIMIDEPELHLNPGLMRGLARFYQEGIGGSQANQLWLVSHSDAFLRDAVRTGGMKVFHMEHCGAGQDNQIHPVDADDEVESLFLELVGDIATFRPTGPLIMLEGAPAGTDKWIVEQLFPKLGEAATVVGVGDAGQTEKVAQVFEAIERQNYQRRRVIAIRDGDATTRRRRRTSDTPGVFEWNRYHIENYLLEEKYVARALRRLTREEATQRTSDQEVRHGLVEIARGLVGDFVRERVEMDLRDGIRRSSRLSSTANDVSEGEDVAVLLAERTAQISRKVADYHASFGQEDAIRERLDAERQELEETLKGDEWKRCFRGRDILGRFVGSFANGIRRDTFVTAVVREMQSDQYRPPEMCQTLERAGLSAEADLAIGGSRGGELVDEPHEPRRRSLARLFGR